MYHDLAMVTVSSTIVNWAVIANWSGVHLQTGLYAEITSLTLVHISHQGIEQDNIVKYHVVANWSTLNTSVHLQTGIY